MRRVTPQHLRQLEADGFVLLRAAFTAESVQALRAGVESLTRRARAGECEIRWLDEDRLVPDRIAHMLHPDKYEPVFGQWLAEDLADDLEALLGSPARHSLFGMLASGAGRPYRLAWHRDVGKPGAPDEVDYLRRHHGRLIQLNAPIHGADRYLQVVPGSHLRASTPQEIAVAAAGAEAPPDMPDALIVEMAPGDILYYNANLWHRGWNPGGDQRWTMHAAFWRAEYPVMAHEHGQREALSAPGHLQRLPARARDLVQRYLDQHGDTPPRLQDL